MYFFVGWHYVKQGYGMLMLDAALKRKFYSASEKRIFLVNAYAAWIFAWSLADWRPRGSVLFGVEPYSIGVPDQLVFVLAAVAGLSFIAASAVLCRRAFLSKEAIAWNGVIAYGVSLYLWMLPSSSMISFLVIPGAHSLQYLAVVARYQLNRLKTEAGDSLWPVTRFFLKSAVLGLAGFWAIPLVLDALIPHHEQIGALAFLPAAWIFINIHHYFIDNVMWRAENPDVRQYLFH